VDGVQTLVVEILAACRRAERLTAELAPARPGRAAADGCLRLRDLDRTLMHVAAPRRAPRGDARSLAVAALEPR
jgi:hypothetical protein